MKKIVAKMCIKEKYSALLEGTFLDDNSYDTLLTEDANVYDTSGNILIMFRKNMLSVDKLKNAYLSWRKSITFTEGRGISSGSSHKRVRKDGSVGKMTVGNKVYSGAVGYMDPNALIRYCRKTSYTRDNFELFKEGVPLVQEVDKFYKELAPEHYALQKKYADATDVNYVIQGTTFTTVTVNKNFRTAVHKDSGDLKGGLGNLSCYREGTFDGCYFCLPEYRIAVDMQMGDMLFVDVHKWHGNTQFKDCSDDFLRISYVMYYRENMYQCALPSAELLRLKMKDPTMPHLK